jgi:hypothetical protein
MVVLVVVLLLVRVVWMRIVDMSCTFGLCLLHPRSSLTSRILHEKLLLL